MFKCIHLRDSLTIAKLILQNMSTIQKQCTLLRGQKYKALQINSTQQQPVKRVK